MFRKIINKSRLARKVILKYKFNKEYGYDQRFFEINYSHSSLTKEKLGYNMLLISHSLEKGMTNKKPRRFGAEKIDELLLNILKYETYNDYETDFVYLNAINVLRYYKEFYKDKQWTDTEEYSKVSSFLESREKIMRMNVGSHVLLKKDFLDDSSIEYTRFLSSRHSVREFQNKRLSESDIEHAVKDAILSPSACNRQMCKIYYIADKTLSDAIISLAQGFGGFEQDTINLFIITFDVNANYFIGERNQGWLNAGLFSMNFVNSLHSRGIGSCFCQFGSKTSVEEQIKKIANISDSERIAVLISAGYYCDMCLTTYSPRKPLSDIYRIR